MDVKMTPYFMTRRLNLKCLKTECSGKYFDLRRIKKMSYLGHWNQKFREIHRAISFVRIMKSWSRYVGMGDDNKCIQNFGGETSWKTST
jgi:hypothetical protein